MIPFDGKCKNLQMPAHMFALTLTVSEYKNVKFLPLKSRSKSLRTILAITPLDDKLKNLQTSFFTIWILTKVWPVRTNVTHTQTHIQRNGQAHRYTRNLANSPKNTPKIKLRILLGLDFWMSYQNFVLTSRVEHQYCGGGGATAQIEF